MGSDLLKVVSDRTEEIDELMGRLPRGPGGPYNGDMEKRVTRLELAVENIQGTMSSMDGKFDRAIDDLSEVKTSQVRTLERMERVMDRARDMPTPSIVDGMITSKLGLSALLVAALAALIAAVTYAS